MSPYTLDDLRRAVEALPPGSSLTLARDTLAELLSGVPVSHAPLAPERLLTVKEAATRLGVSRRYLYEHAKTYPFTKRLSPKVLRFSERGLEQWLARTSR